MKKAAVKSVFSDDLDVLTALEKREGKSSPSLAALRELFRGEDGGTPEVGVDYFTPEEVAQFKKEILAGATPEKFVDYFTDEEVAYICRFVTEEVRDTLTPVKGRDYFDGKPGQKGKDADEGKIIKRLQDLSKEREEKLLSADALAKKLNTLKEAIEPSAIKGWIKIEDVIKAIKEGRLLNLKDLEGSEGFNMNDQRWHGAGTSPSSGGLNRLTVAGTIDDSNVSFTVSDTPTYMIINGAMYAQGDTAGGMVIWTNVAGLVTLAFPVGTGGSISALG
jgi:hypothetical protein